jgi:hypothetical protein
MLPVVCASGCALPLKTMVYHWKLHRIPAMAKLTEARLIFILHNEVVAHLLYLLFRYLQNNNLSGGVPEWLSELGNLKEL